MNRFKAILKISGVVISLLIGVVLWFYIGSVFVGLLRSSVSNWAYFAIVLILLWYLRATTKIIKVLTSQVDNNIHSVPVNDIDMVTDK